MPGLSRPITGSQNPLRAARVSASGARGFQSSVFSGTSSPGGITPTTWNARLLSVMVLPTTSLEPPKRRCHNPYDNTMTPSFPGVSSFSVKSWPSTGFRPMTSKKFAVTCAPRSRSGSPAPVRLNDDGVNPAIWANEEFCDRQSM